jgi:hypothetical protein
MEAQMFLVRDVFQAKPGKAAALARIFKQANEHMLGMEGFSHPRVMTDMVGTYWTVVAQVEVDSIERYISMARTFTSKPEVKEIFKGYMDLVDSGFREIFKLE